MNENNPLISVVIPSYNPGELIRETLESLVKQTYKNFEVILSDDGSTDNTIKIATEYSTKLKLKIIKNKNSGGPATPRNIGIKQAKGDWIAFLDHDDTWRDNKLEQSLKYLKENDVIYHRLEIVNNAGSPLGEVKSRKIKKDAFSDLVVNGNAIANSSSMVRKDLIEKVGFIEEAPGFIAAEDYELWIKISRLTSKFYYIDEVLGGYRLEAGQNLTQSSLRLIEVHENVFNKHSSHLNAKNKKYAEANLSYTRARMFTHLKMIDKAKLNYRKGISSNSISIKIKSLIFCFKISIDRALGKI